MKRGIVTDIALGLTGAVIGGWIFSYCGLASATGFSQDNLLVEVISAAAVLVLFHAFYRDAD